MLGWCAAQRSPWQVCSQSSLQQLPLALQDFIGANDCQTGMRKVLQFYSNLKKE
jgi:hypothetical protein